MRAKGAPRSFEVTYAGKWQATITRSADGPDMRVNSAPRPPEGICVYTARHALITSLFPIFKVFLQMKMIGCLEKIENRHFQGMIMLLSRKNSLKNPQITDFM